MFETPDSGNVPIPAGLDEMAPGAELAAVLADTDVGALSGYDRIVVLRAHQRLVSHYQAQVYADMAAMVDAFDEEDDDDLMWAPEMAATEVRAALVLTRRAADDELARALELGRRLPGVWEALAAGHLDARRVRTILWGTFGLSDEDARTLADAILDQARGLTTGQLAALLRRLRIDLDPDDAHHRCQTAIDRRRVVSEATAEGTANLLGLELSPERVAAATRRINHIARSLRTTSETRTVDQLRADVFLDLLNGKTVTGTGEDQGVVDLHVDLDTLAGLKQHSGDLSGYGPVVADIARQVAANQHDAEWRYVVKHPASGMPVHVGTTKRRPTTSMRRVVEARHRTCIFPGCRMPARSCDLDHRIPWARGGPTTIHHLAPLCRHDHRVRHHGWIYQPLSNGDHLWTSPLGHAYTTSGIPP